MMKVNIYQAKKKGKELMMMMMTHLKDMNNINMIMKENLKCLMKMKV